MRWLSAVAALALLFEPGWLLADPVRSVVAASNSVDITVYSDDFAGRYEYSAPQVQFDAGGGNYIVPSFFLVARIKTSSTLTPIELQGSIYYRGDWRYYESAIFKGGTSANYSSTGRDVVDCSGSSDNCVLSEGFQIALTKPEIAKFQQSGVLEIQLRSRRDDTALLNVPISYIEAVEQVSTGQATGPTQPSIDPPSPPPVPAASAPTAAPYSSSPAQKCGMVQTDDGVKLVPCRPRSQ
jgi:hypothetical protein